LKSGIKPEEVGFLLAYSKNELKKVIKEYPAKEVRKYPGKEVRKLCNNIASCLLVFLESQTAKHFLTALICSWVASEVFCLHHIVP